MDELIDKSLVDSEQSFYPSGRKCCQCKLWVVLTVVLCVVVGACAIGLAVFFVLQHGKGDDSLVWRRVMKCRHNVSDVEAPMQFATLFNTKKGIILAGGGSDIHQTTSRPTLFRSEDDGETWKKVFVGDSDMFSLYSFQELSDGRYVGLVPGYFLQSTDKGLSWSIEAMNDTGMSMMTDMNGTLIVSKNPNYVYRSTNNGETFEEIRYCDANCTNLRAITYAGNNTWYMGAGSESAERAAARVFKSIDNGVSWEEVFRLETAESDFVVFSVFAYDTDNVLIGTGVGKPGERMIHQTENGGKTWEVRSVITEDFDPSLTIVRSFYKGNDGRLFACLDCSYSSSETWADEPDLNKNSMIVVSNDKGKTWSSFARTETKRLYWMSETTDGCFIATTGEYGEILKSEPHK